MHEDFVPYELAVKLKEKGFKEKCLAYYDIDDNVGLLHNTQYGDEYSPYQYTDLLQSHNTDPIVVQPDDSENCCDAPTISQVLKWLREEKKLHISIEYGYEEIPVWDFEIRLIGTYGRWWTDETYSSYELAVFAGIEYVIDNLI